METAASFEVRNAPSSYPTRAHPGAPLLSFRTAALTIVTTAVFMGLVLSATLLEFSFELNSRCYQFAGVRLAGPCGQDSAVHDIKERRDWARCYGFADRFNRLAQFVVALARCILVFIPHCLQRPLFGDETAAISVPDRW